MTHRGRVTWRAAGEFGMAVRAKKTAAGTARGEAARKEAARPVHAAAAPASPLRVNGSLDRVGSDGTLEGWCWSPDEPGVQRTLAVLIDGKEVARLRADRLRDDLAAAGFGTGRHAFRYVLDPALLSPGKTVAVALRDLSTGQPVGAPVTATWRTAAVPALPSMDKSVPVLSGNIDRVSRDGWVSGWCWFPDQPEAHVELAVLVDGVKVGEVRADTFRPDLREAGIGDGTHGFAFALPYSVLADRGTLTVVVQELRSGRPLGDPITARIGRMAAMEERVQDLERQIRLLQSQLEDMRRIADARDEEQEARSLFATVAAFFQDLAEGGPGSIGLAGALARVTARWRPLDLAVPDRPLATICIAATAPFDEVRACLGAVHAAGLDAMADVVVLDDGREGPELALLPSVVRNLRYVSLRDGSDLGDGRNDLARTARGELLAFVAPEVRVNPGWLDEAAATLRCEPQAALVCGRLAREDGMLQHAGLLATAGGMLYDYANLAQSDDPAFGFLRPVDAVSGAAFVIRRQALLDVGGFSRLFSRFGHAVADLCARLRAAGHAVLYQPLATATWHDRGCNTDADPPNLSLPDEETLRLAERLHDGWPSPVAFAGRALVIDDDLPRPDRDAGSIATLEQMRLLRRLGYQVTFAPMHAAAIDPDAIAALAREGIALAAPPRWPSVTDYLRAEGEALDLVHIYRYPNAALLQERVRELAPRAKLVFATADLHHLREGRRAAMSGRKAAAAAREAELRCMRKADATIVTSDFEHALLRDDVDAEKLVLLRWITRPVPPARGFDGRRDICFVGNFRHLPNIDGIEWFVTEVLPRVRRELPTLRLLLAGSDMPASIADLASDAVEVRGWVPSLSDLFGSVRLSVAPLRFGAGFKGKVATSLAHGLPVVGSSTSLEGTGLADGDGVMIADDPADFAHAIVRLHEDAALWGTLSARALERVAALYSPEAAMEIWRRLLEQLQLPVALN
jgi:glycosyltransferase involved in cell wall biosynthesis